MNKDILEGEFDLYLDIIDDFELHLGKKYNKGLFIGRHETLEAHALLRVFPYVYMCELIRYIEELEK